MPKIKANSFQNYYMYGRHACLAALNNPNRKINKIFVTSENFEEYKKLIGDHSYEVIDNKGFNKLLPTDAIHQGFCLSVKPLEDIAITELGLNLEQNTLAILDQVSDPHNLGAIIRTAAAFGIKGIIIPKDNSPPESAIVAKTASGTLELVPVCRVTNLATTIKILKDNGFWIIGLAGEGKEYINAKQFKGKSCIILGAEGKGMRRLTKENCDLLVKIPISRNVESLNVSNAAAIAFYEASKVNS